MKTIDNKQHAPKKNIDNNKVYTLEYTTKNDIFPL